MPNIITSSEVDNIVVQQDPNVITVIGTQGLTGVQGLTGPQGAGQGLTGVQGLTGQQAITGIQGITGVGVQGLTGIWGLTGVQGITGFQAPTGVQGLTGVWGITGVQGITGIRGITGVQGITGVWGITGLLFTTTGIAVPNMTGMGYYGGYAGGYTGTDEIYMVDVADHTDSSVGSSRRAQIGQVPLFASSVTGVGGGTANYSIPIVVNIGGVPTTLFLHGSTGV